MADPFLATLGVADPTDATPAAASKAPDPLDAAIRTIWAESSTDSTERKWVAGVIANRAKAGKKSLSDIVQEPGQFEPWSTVEGRKRMQSLDPGSEDYQQIAKLASPVLRGENDPTGGATKFYAPEAQAQLAAKDGRPVKPAWDDGSGVAVGKTMFFGGNAKAPDPFLSTLGVDADQADAAAEDASKATVRFEGLPKNASAGQSKTWLTLARGGILNTKAPPGSENHPYGIQPGMTEKDVPPGAYYIPVEGGLKRAPGGEKDSSFGAGLGMGGGDVLASLSHLAPGTDDSDVKNTLLASQLLYGAKYGGDFKSGAGRFTGQVLASAPAIAGGEALAAPALAAAGAPGAFVAGEGGMSMAPGALRLLTRAGSLATHGALQGGEAAALTSSADDAPLSRQVGQGMVGGAFLGPVLPAAAGAGRWAGNTLRSLAEPMTTKGREAIVNRIIGNFGEGGNMTPHADEIIPGSVPTLSMATGNPGLATLERTVRLGRPTPFAERAAQNSEARSAVLDAARGDEHSVADLVNTRNGILTEAGTRAFNGATPVDPQGLVGKIDEALDAPAAHMEEVKRPLQTLRDKLVQPPPETTPEQTAAFQQQVAQSFGADAKNLTPEVMSEARNRLGAKFEEIASKTKVDWDDKALSDVTRIIHDTSQVVPESSMPPLFKQLANITSTVKDAGADGQRLSGASYQALTKKGAPLSSLQNSSDPTIRDAANNIREALDDALERSVGSTPEGAATLADLRATRLQYKNLKTTEVALRSAGPDKQVTPQAVLSAVKRNFGQFAYKGGGPLGDAAETAVKEQASRAPVVENDPKQLYGMRQSLTKSIEGLEKAGGDANQAAADHLKGVRDHLDATIETGAPGYRDFLDMAKRSHEPVQAMKFLQSLRLTDATGKITLGRVSSALQRIQDMRGKPGDNAAKTISGATLHQLESLHADLLRENNINLGRPLGPDTAQHLVTGNIAAQQNVPLAVGAGALMHHPLVGAALGAGKLYYGGKNEQVLDALAQRLLQPETSAAPVRPVPKSGKLAGAAKRVLSAAVPVTGGLASTRLLSAQ